MLITFTSWLVVHTISKYHYNSRTNISIFSIREDVNTHPTHMSDSFGHERCGELTGTPVSHTRLPTYPPTHGSRIPLPPGALALLPWFSCPPLSCPAVPFLSTPFLIWPFSCYSCSFCLFVLFCSRLLFCRLNCLVALFSSRLFVFLSYFLPVLLSCFLVFLFSCCLCLLIASDFSAS